MAKKTFTIAASILAIMFTLTLASALSITSFPSEISQSDSSFNITVDSNVTGLTYSATSNINEVTFGSITEYLDGANTILNVPYQTNDFNFDILKDYSVTVTVDDGVDNVSKEIPFEETDYCGTYENKGRLDLEIEDINVQGFGDEDDYWYLMDNIEVEITVLNDGSWDVENIEVEWELYTDDGTLIMDDTESDFDLKDDDDTRITFSFQLDENMDEFEGKDVILYIKATGEIDDKDSDYDGDKTCAWIKSSSVEVVTGDDFVIVQDLEINSVSVEDVFSETLGCSQEVTITGSLYNIGEDDQDDVYVEIYSSALELYKKVEFSQIDAYESEDFSYTFKVPKEIDEKNYKIEFEVFNEDNDIFENSEDDESRKTIQVKVEGKCKVIPPTVSTQLLSEEVRAGKELVIRATITNMEDKAVLYTVSAEDFDTWARLITVKPEVVSIPAGDSKDVELVFEMKKDALGTQTMNVKTIYNGASTLTQPVTIEVSEGTVSIGDFFTKDNLKIAGIVLLNLILIIAIVIVARKIVRKR